MYKVLVVDDEVATVKHISMIISMKCPEFQVSGTAENGREALDCIEAEEPDVLITDMKMPVMDGIVLLEKLKERHPQIWVIVISGYQEFEYAKVAIKSGVFDYLLKPIKPSALQTVLLNLKSLLDAAYSEKRNLIMKSLCEGTKVSRQQLQRYFPFPSCKYYAAIVRKNGLPRRFSGNTGTEIFSGKDEILYSYGRDEMESLYLCPETIVFYKSFYQMIAQIVEREKKESNYVTAVVKDASFELEKSADVFRELYQALNNHIIIGRNQILVAEEIREEREILPEEQENLENFESLLERRDIPKAKMKCREIFRIWKETGKSQIYVETKVRYLFMLLNRYHLLAETEKNCEWIIDDLFYFATDIDEILNVILQTMFLKPQKGIRTGKADTPEFFGMIESYIRKNLAAPISMQLLCREFGISQTYLSKLFRKYENCSFNKFLNTTRMERAKELMEENKFYYVKDIAAKVGFDDQYYFSRIFTSMTGMCPTDYMEQFSDKEGSSI